MQLDSEARSVAIVIASLTAAGSRKAITCGMRTFRAE
jgi:hypothetical protein